MSTHNPDAIYDDEGFIVSLKPSYGYMAVEWADDVVHAINIDDAAAHDRPMWRTTPVCDSAGPGVSSDEGGPDAIRPLQRITCINCIGVLA